MRTPLTTPTCVILLYSGVSHLPEIGRRHELLMTEIIIGSSPEADIQLAQNVAAPKHAKLYFEEGQWYLYDLTFTNETYIQGTITGHGKIPVDGGVFQVGKACFKFLTGHGPEVKAFEQLYQMLSTDPLTGIYNRRFLQDTLEREIARCYRYQGSLSLILFDIDHFKEINDQYGHLGGDLVLRELAARIQSRVRKDEFFARYGGEEFAILLPEAIHQQALTVAAQICELVATQPFHYEQYKITATISSGVATLDKEMTPEQLIQKADDFLYQAKQEGRNRVVG